MGTIKDRNGMDLTEAEDAKRWQEYTEELYKNDLQKDGNDDPVCKTAKKTQMCITDFWTQRERGRVG